jgi:hypothetical protein
MSEVQQATWEKVIEKHGFSEYSKGLATTDPFLILAQQAQQAKDPVKVTLGLVNGGDFGQVKVYVNIQVPVYPLESAISMASEAAFVMAHRMVNEASIAIGLPPLP